MSDLQLILNPEPERVPSPLLRVPDEIIGEVCAALSVNFQQWEWPVSQEQWAQAMSNLGDLKRFNQTSRRIHAVSTPYLYHSLIYDYRDANKMLTFTRTLAKCPQLADHVKYLASFREADYVEDHRRVARRAFREHRVYFYDDMDYVGTDHRDEGRQHGFLIDQILNLTQHVQRLSLFVPEFGKYGVLLKPSADLSNVRELNLWTDGEPYVPSLDQARSLWKHLPNLEHLSFHVSNMVITEITATNLKSINFDVNSFIRSGYIRNLIKSCKGLESFTCRHFPGRESSIANDETIMTPRVIVEELSLCKSTLRHLHIELDDWACERFEVHNCVLPSLRDFSALKQVVLGRHCFYNNKLDNVRPIMSYFRSLFPDSIEAIRIQNIENEPLEVRIRLYRVIEELERCARLLPSLRQFHFEGPFIEKENLADRYRTLVAQAEQKMLGEQL